MTDDDPRKRAAETKQRRTRERLIQAADACIKRDGLTVTAEAIATEAGVGTSTFFKHFETRGAMFTEVFRELVHGAMPGEPLLYYYDENRERHDARFAIEGYLQVLYYMARGREMLIRGALIARLEDPPTKVSYADWLTSGRSEGDIALEVADDLKTIVVAEWDKSRLADEADEGYVKRSISTSMTIQAIALHVLDLLSVGTEMNIDYLAGALIGELAELRPAQQATETD